MKKREYTPQVFIGQNLYIKPNYVVSIPEYHREGGNLRSLDFLANTANLQDNKQKGKLSRKAITGLKNSINWLCISARKKRVFVKEQNREFQFKVNFITLTLPDTAKPITSNELQKCLNSFLTYMRKYQSLKNYVWRLEFQANGKLHVHLTCDSFIHHKIIRDTWNRILDNSGHMEIFYKKHGHRDPNSTDVHATKKVKNMAAYLAKYMSKKNSVYKLSKRKTARKLAPMDWKAWYFQRLNFWNSPFNPRPISGRIWGCSKELSKANKLTVHIPADQCSQDLRCLMNKEIEFKSITAPVKETIYSTYAQEKKEPLKIGEVYFLKAVDWFTKIFGPIRKAFEDTRQAIASLNENLSFELA